MLKLPLPMERAALLAGASFLLFNPSILLALSPAASLAGVPDGMRLIETGIGSRAWMSEAEIQELSKLQHAKGKCGGFVDVTEHPDEKPVFVIPMLSFEDRPIRQGAVVRPLLEEISATRMNDFVRDLSAFQNRYYQSQTGVQAANWIRDKFRELAGSRADITVETFSHSFAQPSVIARIAGSGPKANERIVLGAHLDSVNWYSGGNLNARRAPGADDDASGVATLLEAFRAMAESGYRPERTIEFMGYAGEERGLLGSQDIARRYRNQNIPVVAVFQLDMTMAPGPGRELSLIDDHVNQPLTAYTGRLIDEYLKLPWKPMSCGYGCSDHASWDSQGYAAAFPFESPEDLNDKIHTERDTLESLDSVFGSHFAKLAVAFAIELAAGE